MLIFFGKLKFHNSNRSLNSDMFFENYNILSVLLILGQILLIQIHNNIENGKMI